MSGYRSFVEGRLLVLEVLELLFVVEGDLVLFLGGRVLAAPLAVDLEAEDLRDVNLLDGGGLEFLEGLE